MPGRTDNELSIIKSPFFDEKYIDVFGKFIDSSLYRPLSEGEIKILENNYNYSLDWSLIRVKDGFDPVKIRNSEFNGVVYIGEMSKDVIVYHDLHQRVGIYNSCIYSAVIGDNCSLKNVHYMANYIVKDRCILFNINEIATTAHSKFGRGIVKEGEEESVRVWLEVANENGGRRILPFEEMIPADAFLWSMRRDDDEFQDALLRLTEKPYMKERGVPGVIGSNTVIKHTSIVKDVNIGAFCYIKGANKLKNITVLSSSEEPSQIGEGVEMVNGIMGYGSNVFYGAVAVRFVIGRNCQLKYGARLLNSVLGDNSNVSCCELLNNIIFPFHEQHHNNSFLIATIMKGQSNIAAGATIGSNHNSRSADGEITAGRGFWPGLSSSFKHNSKFASFTLASKGSYQYEINLVYPFSLIYLENNCRLIVRPGYWFVYNMYAIVRNDYKFAARDKRVNKVQNIEYNYLAPDTVSEMINAVERILSLTGLDVVDMDILKKYKELHDPLTMKKHGAVLVNPAKSVEVYCDMVKYYLLRELVGIVKEFDYDIDASFVFINEECSKYRADKWLNIGGQVMTEESFHNLVDMIKGNRIKTWEEVHEYYDGLESERSLYRGSFIVELITRLQRWNILPSAGFERNFDQKSKEFLLLLINDGIKTSELIRDEAFKSREKDYNDPYRKFLYESDDEMQKVVGSIDDNDFLNELVIDTESFLQDAEKLRLQVEKI